MSHIDRYSKFISAQSIKEGLSTVLGHLSGVIPRDQRPKPTVVDDKFFEHPDTMSVSKKTIPVDYSVASEHGTIHTKEGPMPVRPGFHVIDRGNGDKYATPAEEFHKLYDDHGNGKASPKPIMKVARPASGEGQVKTGWGETLPFKEGQDMIVRHGTGDYGVVKNDIFHKTYNVHGKAYK